MRQQPDASIATLMVSGEPELDDNVLQSLVDARLGAAGHSISARAQIADSEAAIRSQLVTWISAPEIRAIVVTAGWNSARALAPLVTESLPHGVRCGSTLVFVLPPSLSEISDLLDRVVVPELSKMRPLSPMRSESCAEQRLTTDAIAVIGDLPPASDAMAMVDLRGGRRGLWTIATVAAVAAGVLLGVVFKAHEDRQAHAAASVETLDDLPVPEASAPPREPIAAPATAPKTPPITKPAVPHTPKAPAQRVAKTVHRPAAPALDVPPELETVPVVDEDSCTQESCASHGNERECCTPFRAHPARLDRAMIARAIAAVKSNVLDCRATGADGVVKVSLEISSEGHVTKAVVVESPEASVGQCVASTLREASFPSTVAGGSFVYRIDLAP